MEGVMKQLRERHVCAYDGDKFEDGEANTESLSAIFRMLLAVFRMCSGGAGMHAGRETLRRQWWTFSLCCVLADWGLLLRFSQRFLLMIDIALRGSIPGISSSRCSKHYPEHVGAALAFSHR